MASAATVIGLTGGIASGKSAVAALLRERGAAVVDADELARQVVAPGRPALAELVARFGPEILQPDGQLDRKKLGAIVFTDAQARADLGRITHPRIAQASQAAIAAAADAGAGIVFYEAALLVENGLHRNLDAVVVVAVPVQVQLQRLVQRDQLPLEAAEARIAAQLPLSEKLEAATWVIDNRHDPQALRREVERVVSAIEQRFGPIVRLGPAVAGAATQGDSEGERDRKDDSEGDRDRAATEGEREGAAPPAVATAPTTGHRPAPERCALVTGFPSVAARRIIERLVTSPPATKVCVLVSATHAGAAESFAESLGHNLGHSHSAHRHLPSIAVLVGDVASIHLGLSSAEYQALTRELTLVHHLCGVDMTWGSEALARRAMITGTEAIMDLARNALRLQRLVHWSSAMVSGLREGLVLESELVRDPGFAHPRLHMLCDAEALAQAAARQVPVTVLRPSLIVGDSRTGEVDRSAPWFDGLYRLIERIAAGTEVRAHPSPRGLPSRLWQAAVAHLPAARAPVHAAPIDFVVATAHALSSLDSAAGKTFHLTDPTPMRADELVMKITELCGTTRDRASRARLGPQLRAAVRWWRDRSPDAAAAPVWGPEVRYDQRNTLAGLELTGMTCPTLSSYLDKLVQTVLAGEPPQGADRGDEGADGGGDRGGDRGAGGGADEGVDDPLAP